MGEWYTSWHGDIGCSVVLVTRDGGLGCGECPGEVAGGVCHRHLNGGWAVGVGHKVETEGHGTICSNVWLSLEVGNLKVLFGAGG